MEENQDRPTAYTVTQEALTDWDMDTAAELGLTLAEWYQHCGLNERGED